MDPLTPTEQKAAEMHRHMRDADPDQYDFVNMSDEALFDMFLLARRCLRDHIPPDDDGAREAPDRNAP